MAEFKITRFRYTWRGNWSGDSITYYKDDVVFHRGSTWVCIRQHSSNNFYSAQDYTVPGETQPSPAWVKSADGKQYIGDWNASTSYDVGSLVSAGGNVYLCIVGHTSGTYFSTNIANWEVFAVGSNFRNAWTASTRYRVGDVVRYNGFTYQCVLEHTSGAADDGVIVGNLDSTDDSTAETWNVVVENYTFVGSHQTSTRYRLNDLVKYGGSLLKCIAEHTSSAVEGQIDNTNFTTYLSGFEYDSEWNVSTYYAIGDVTKYGGQLYIANQNNFASQPGVSAAYELGHPAWTLIFDGVDYQGVYDFQSDRFYKKGDVIRRGGSLWISLVNQLDDDSSSASLDPSLWKPVIIGQNWKGSWHVDVDYDQYDIVYFKGVTYYANSQHLSSFDNFPGDSGSGFNLWNVLIEGDSNAVLSNVGDLLTYNTKRELIKDGSTSFYIGDTSTIGTTTVPIGDPDHLLMVSNNTGDLGYEEWGTLQRVVWVRTDGVDENTDPDRGINYFKPWRTLRYALEQVDDGYLGTTSIKLGTGEYQEILPLIVPARTAIIGDELRSTTVRASEPIAALAEDAAYTLATLSHLKTVVTNILLGNLVTPTTGNTEVQDTSLTVTTAISDIVEGLFTDIMAIIDYKVNDVGSSPVVSGTNTITYDMARLDAKNILENNRAFIKAEAIAYMTVNNPLYAFDTELCQRDVDRYIDAMKYDVCYPGNYKSVLAGRYYANAVIGSALEDMFYVRDTTGIRNLTLKGLQGTLPALQEGETYRTPTGGAFVSLDPGWGPNDERVWILNRSCYIQNVTTFGTAAVGQKVDGNLHNGGNRSIVSNDFTQVISDGIGAWILNGGRAELVSVFTYYAHIGMFAQDGGIIRATNGNSSYGDFGALADGIDPEETVRYANVNTRSEQAVVAAAFAGEVLDFILGLEFVNCGQNYTTASYSITSSGTGATAIQEEFRDDAMFTVQMLDAGAGFSQAGNQAQTGNTTQITLATAETLVEADILGKRIIIISGEGTGQYGYVYSFNDITKVCVVYKESTDTPGWDHVLPGTPITSLLTSGTRYRIEPRVTFSDPPYSCTETGLPATRQWSSAVYGETSEVFTNVTGTAGTGETIEVVPAAALFTITKLGRSYTVLLTDGGAGYAQGDTITISGSQVGGTDIEHDIVITVATVSNDSTNSILTYNIADDSLIAASGKFILLPANHDGGLYSLDGQDWEDITMPSSGNWNCVAAGNNMFVAIRNASNAAAYSTNGVDWTASSMPSSRNWTGVAYGKPSTVDDGVFVAVSANLNSAAYSIDGVTWTSSTLPTFGDSTLNEYVDIAFGSNVFVALANSGNIVAVGTWDGSNLTWTGSIMDVVQDSSQKDWTSIAYGNRRFVAVSSTGEVAYSFEGTEWYAATMPTQDGSTAHYWRQIRYGQGVFFAVGDTGSRNVAADPTTGETTFAATSYDGIVWTPRELTPALNWGIVAFGNPDITSNDSTLTNSKPIWLTFPTTSSNTYDKISVGATALGRAVVSGSGIGYIKIWEPGSGYDVEPTLTLTDPGKTEEIQYRIRMADGVLAQPKFITKGSSYKTSTTFVTVTGDGFADKTPNGKFITLDNIEVMPGPGAQFYIGNLSGYWVAVVIVSEEQKQDGTYLATFQISPNVDYLDYIEHGMEVLIRERYSQVRITGHDFLDIGSGNFETTNYPTMYAEYDYNKEPFQEVYDLNGGRVFYTSTDQDGNFRAGNQFAVEQATGIITISADFFDLAGLTELRLAGINVGSTAVIREFSKDATFSQNSNNVIPTQRAIIAYLQSRLNVGGEDLLTPSFIAGTVLVGPNLINSTAAQTIEVDVLADFRGAGVGLSGSYIASLMHVRRLK
jgi:hypothetical protein